MRRLLVAIAIAGGLLAAAAAIFAFSPSLQDRLVERIVMRAVTSRPMELFEPDALRVVFCGSAGPFPHPSRERPCVAVFAAGRFWVVDAGPGSWNTLALARVPAQRIGAVLLTHFHSDHIGELGEINLQTWVAGRPRPLPVYGPPGVGAVVAGFQQAYALDTGYRVAHHGADLLPPETAQMEAREVRAEEGSPASFLEEGDLRITAIRVNHAPVDPAYAYRFDWRGRSVVVSGDTAKHPGLAEAARGADVLVHEAQANHLVAAIGKAARDTGNERIARIMADIPDYHSTPVQAAEVANEAGVRLLALYHLTPPPPIAALERIYTRGVAEVRPDGWVLADDGMLIEVPLGDGEIVVRSLP
jgi:ribonuclease Z